MEHFLLLFVGAALVNNIVLSRFLGICPFMGVSKSSETAIGMSLSVAFVMTISSTVSFIIDKFILVPLHLENLRTIVFILMHWNIRLISKVLDKINCIIFNKILVMK